MHLLEESYAHNGVHHDIPGRTPSVTQNSSQTASPAASMDHLDALEAQSIYIFREAFARLKRRHGGLVYPYFANVPKHEVAQIAEVFGVDVVRAMRRYEPWLENPELTARWIAHIEDHRRAYEAGDGR